MKTLCVSLDTAKALKAAGWTKPTAFYWSESPLLMSSKDLGGKPFPSDCPAPTAEEVLRELPLFIDAKKFDGRREREERFTLLCKPDEVMYQCLRPLQCLWAVERIGRLSEAAAQMYIWCVEQGYIKAAKQEEEK